MGGAIIVILDFSPRPRESGGANAVETRASAICQRALVRIRIYGIIGFSGFSRRAFSAGKRSSIFVLAGFPVMAKSASRAKRNPENPANPVNPDSDKYARAEPTAFAVWIPAFAGMTGLESGNGGVKSGMSAAPVLAGFPIMARSASRANRNPVNLANPVNPDSDESPRAPTTPAERPSSRRRG